MWYYIFMVLPQLPSSAELSLPLLRAQPMWPQDNKMGWLLTLLISCRAVSLESSLNEAHHDMSAMTPFSSKKKSKKLGGSLEKMIHLLTPKKSYKAGRDEPKKTKVGDCLLHYTACRFFDFVFSFVWLIEGLNTYSLGILPREYDTCSTGL